MKSPNTAFLVRIALLSLFGLAAFFLWYSKSSEEPLVTTELWDEEGRFVVKPFERWYQINWYQQTVGFATTRLEKKSSESSKNSRWQLVQDEYFEGRVQGRFVSFDYKTRYFFETEAPYRLLSGELLATEPDLTVIKQFEHNADFSQLNVSIERNGRVRNYELPALDYTLMDHFKLENAVVKRLHSKDPVRQSEPVLQASFSEDYFEPSSLLWGLSLQQKTAQSHWVAELKSSQLSAFERIEFNHKGQVQRKLRANGMEFVPSQGKISLNTAMQPDLYQTNGIQLSNSHLLTRIHQIQELELELDKYHILEVDDAAHGLPRYIQQQGNSLHVSRPRAYQATPDSAAAAQLRLAQFQEESDKSFLLEPLMRESDRTQTPWDLSLALMQRTHDYLHYQTSPAGLSLEDIVLERRGDCTEYSLLFSSLLSYYQIPHRVRTGFIYLGKEEQQLGGHAWLEVLVDGQWRGLDPTWNLKQLTSLHLPIRILPRDKQNSLQATEIQVKSVVH